MTTIFFEERQQRLDNLEKEIQALYTYQKTPILWNHKAFNDLYEDMDPECIPSNKD